MTLVCAKSTLNPYKGSFWAAQVSSTNFHQTELVKRDLSFLFNCCNFAITVLQTSEAANLIHYSNSNMDPIDGQEKHIKFNSSINQIRIWTPLTGQTFLT